MPPRLPGTQHPLAATDVREGGHWTLRQRIKNNALYILIRAATGAFPRLPHRVLLSIGRGAGRAAWHLLPRERQRALENLQHALPELDASARDAIVRRCFASLGELLGEAVSQLNPRREIAALPFAPGALDVLTTAIAEGRGVVFASAHLGPWERVAWTVAHADVPFTIVAREPYDPRLRRIYDRLRTERGIQTLYRGERSAGAALVRVLRRGGVLGIPMDLFSRAESIAVPFFGRSCLAPVGPARLAVRMGCPVIVGTARQGGDGSLAIDCSRIETRNATEREITGAIYDELAKRIRTMPEAWPWMHHRWSDS